MTAERTNAPAPIEHAEQPFDGGLQLTWTRGGGIRRITIEIDGVGTTTVDCAAEPEPDTGSQIEQRREEYACLPEAR